MGKTKEIVMICVAGLFMGVSTMAALWFLDAKDQKTVNCNSQSQMVSQDGIEKENELWEKMYGVCKK